MKILIEHGFNKYSLFLDISIGGQLRTRYFKAILNDTMDLFDDKPIISLKEGSVVARFDNWSIDLCLRNVIRTKQKESIRFTIDELQELMGVILSYGK